MYFTLKLERPNKKHKNYKRYFILKVKRPKKKTLKNTRFLSPFNLKGGKT